MEQPNSLTGSAVKKLGEFSGEEIKRCEEAEEDANCCDRYVSGSSSRKTAAAIQLP